MAKVEDKTLWLRFSGEGLDVTSIPIYELGDTLIAIQRIVHKSFLFREGRLKHGAHLTQAERQRLSLQIRERQKSSDAYALIPFVADPVIQQYVYELLKIGLGSLAKYATRAAFSDPDSKGKSTTGTQDVREVAGSQLTGAIYAETVTITNHIYNIGNIEKIDLILGAKDAKPVVSMSEETRDYVRETATMRYFGDPTEISGYLTKLRPNRFEIDLKLGPKRYVKVRVNPKDFDFIRYQTQQDHKLTFVGRPVYRLEKSAANYDEFKADSVRATSEIDEL